MIFGGRGGVRLSLAALVVVMMLIGVVWVLIVSCLLVLFYEVGVSLGTIWYGYVDSRDKPMETKLNSNAKCLKPDAIKLI